MCLTLPTLPALPFSITCLKKNEWEEKLPDKYRCPSRKLIELRSMARGLALCGKFDEAQDRKIEAEQLEAKETKEAQKRLNKEYSIAKKQANT